MSNSTSFTNNDVEEILRVVDRLTDVEVKLETSEFKLHVRKGAAAPALSQTPVANVESPAPRTNSASQPATPAVTVEAAAPFASPNADEGAVAIKAPMLGRFYRAPSPSEPPYVEVGKRVSPDDTVCMIEVMKLFKTVNAGVTGTIVSIAVSDGDMVEDDQPLFYVKPD